MSYVYILKSKKDGNKYTGSTINLTRRLDEHFSGKVKSTKDRRPLELCGYRKFNTIKEAVVSEKKYRKSHDSLRKDIENGEFIIVGD